MARLLLNQNGTERKVFFLPPMRLSALLRAIGVSLWMPCGGEGRCGKCAVEADGFLSSPTEEEVRCGRRLLCRTDALGDCSVTLNSVDGMEMKTGTQLERIPPDPSASGLGAAVDVGTTTLAVRLYRLSDGTFAGESTRVNPQTAVSADVIGRIGAALNGRGEELRSLVRGAMAQMIRELAGREPVTRTVIVGNTTMLYLMNAYDVKELASAPFHASHLFGEHVEENGRDVSYPPCFHAFAGADLSAAILASGMCREDNPALLCDVGTNGEIALFRDGRLYVTSTAAGPALEGAGISCGCPSVPGAVDRVWLEEGNVRFHTIRDEKAVGVCGSGLIDLLAVLLETGILDEGGRLREPYVLTEGVVLQPEDVRSLQLAKAAICGGIRTLLERTETRAEDVASFHVAGGFGSRIDPVSAAAIGLFPAGLTRRMASLGNAALRGASMLLSDPAAEEEILRIAERGEYLSLSGDPVFADNYVDCMAFAKF